MSTEQGLLGSLGWRSVAEQPLEWGMRRPPPAGVPLACIKDGVSSGMPWDKAAEHNMHPQKQGYRGMQHDSYNVHTSIRQILLQEQQKQLNVSNVPSNPVITSSSAPSVWHMAASEGTALSAAGGQAAQELSRMQLPAPAAQLYTDNAATKGADLQPTAGQDGSISGAPGVAPFLNVYAANF